jgi:uncharacterized RmlC-like cupin family protein
MGNVSCITGFIRGNGSITTTQRSIGEFSRLQSGGSATVRVHEGLEYAVEITTDSNLASHVRTEVVGGELRLGLDWGSYSFTKLIIDVYSPALHALAAVSSSGSGVIEILEPLQSQSMSMRISGSGSIKADLIMTDLIMTELEFVISGSGAAKITGRSKALSLRISGSGEFNGRDFEAERASVRVSGSGRARVWASQSLDAVISGSGDLFYRGNPQMSTHISGSGKIRPE